MSQNYGQIKNHRGDTIKASRDSRMLYDAGWRICFSEQRGMFKRVFWIRLSDESREPYTQAQAILIEKEKRINGYYEPSISG